MNSEAEWLSPEEPGEIVGTCPVCGGEIYKGELVYRINGERIHEDCIFEWVHQTYDKDKEEAE